MPNFWFGCDCFTDMIFILDILVQLRTGYLEQGLVVSVCFLFNAIQSLFSGLLLVSSTRYEFFRSFSCYLFIVNKKQAALRTWSNWIDISDVGPVALQSLQITRQLFPLISTIPFNPYPFALVHFALSKIHQLKCNQDKFSDVDYYETNSL